MSAKAVEVKQGPFLRRHHYRELLMLLHKHGELNVSRLMVLLNRTQPATSFLLDKLLRSGFVEYRREGKKRWYKLTESTAEKVVLACKALEDLGLPF